MRLSLKFPLFLILGLFNPLSVSLSTLPEESEGSAYNLDGSGLGDGSELASSDENENIMFEANNKELLAYGDTFWPTGDDAFESVLSKKKSFMDSQEITTAFVIGGVAGVIIGAVVAGILIYRHKERSQKTSADEDYHKPIRDEAFV